MNNEIYKYKCVIDFIRKVFNSEEYIHLHTPIFLGNEKKYLNECIDSMFVSSVGKFGIDFEKAIAEYTGSKYAISSVNGTAALHIALLISGVKRNEEVITQPLTFIATANAISYCGANPVFVDVDMDTMGLSADKLEEFLFNNTFINDLGLTYNKITGNRIAACVPMHTFGHPSKIDKIIEICDKYQIPVVEDAAESIGSRYLNKHTGSFGLVGTLSFNGNKTITCGGGGMILTNNKEIAKKAKHLTTQAKVPHRWEFIHDEIGYNYRMPNINAALGLAQLEQLDGFIKNKRELASNYKEFFQGIGIRFFNEPENSFSNYWLNSVILKDQTEKNNFLEFTNKNGIMTRPIWGLMNVLEMFKNSFSDNLDNSNWLSERVVNIPSGVRL